MFNKGRGFSSAHRTKLAFRFSWRIDKQGLYKHLCCGHIFHRRVLYLNSKVFRTQTFPVQRSDLTIAIVSGYCSRSRVILRLRCCSTGSNVSSVFLLVSEAVRESSSHVLFVENVFHVQLPSRRESPRCCGAVITPPLLSILLYE